MDETEKLRDTIGSILINAAGCYYDLMSCQISFFMGSLKPSFLQELLQDIHFVFSLFR